MIVFRLRHEVRQKHIVNLKKNELSQLSAYVTPPTDTCTSVVLPHKKYEIKYHQVSPTLQCLDYQFFMCDTWLKKSLTKYHQVSPTFLAMIPYKHLSVYCLYIRLFVGSFMYLFCGLAVFVTFETPRFVP
jgi:hypothetical protein